MASDNEAVFSFLKQRASFVRTYPGVEAFVVWGAAADALARIHARRLGTSFSPNGKCFAAALVDLTRGGSVDLSTVSVPLLRTKLRHLANEPNADAATVALARAFAHGPGRGQIWSMREDLASASGVRATLVGTPQQRLLDRFRYSDVLYREYRCAFVHSLDGGSSTSSGMGDPREAVAPAYMNYGYLDGDPSDPRGPQSKPPVKITFGQPLLAKLLDEMLAREEQECRAAGYEVPRYATHDDD